MGMVQEKQFLRKEPAFAASRLSMGRSLERFSLRVAFGLDGPFLLLQLHAISLLPKHVIVRGLNLGKAINIRMRSHQRLLQTGLKKPQCRRSHFSLRWATGRHAHVQRKLRHYPVDTLLFVESGSS
jgi:hypothetical protein